MARDRLSRGVELQQLLGHVAHGLFHPRLGFFPRGTAELVEGRRRTTGVLLDEIEPFQRHEQLVLAGIAELHELLLRRSGAARGELLQADELADAVVDVDNKVADLEVPKVRQKGARRRTASLGRAPLFLEQIAFREDAEIRIAHAKAACELTGRHEHRRAAKVIGFRDGACPNLIVAKQLDRPFGAPRRRRDEQHVVSLFTR